MLIVHVLNSTVNFDAYIVTMFTRKGITNKLYSFDLHWSCIQGIIIADRWLLGVHDVKPCLAKLLLYGTKLCVRLLCAFQFERLAISRA